MGLFRVLLALSVVIAHSGDFMGLHLVGVVAVESFFIISGFYMGMIWTEKYKGHSRLFYGNRFLRIFPVYWVVLALTVGLYLLLWIVTGKASGGLHQYVTYWDETSFWILTLGIVSNFFIFGQDILTFIFNQDGMLTLTNQIDTEGLSAVKLAFIPQAWTLSLELMFYLLVPYIMRFSTMHLVYLCGLTFILRFVLSLYGYVLDPWNYRFFPLELGFFLLGVISYRIYSANQENREGKSFMLWGLILFITTYEFIPVINEDAD